MSTEINDPKPPRVRRKNRPKFGAPPPEVGYDGRLWNRQGRWRYFQVYGKRCRYCEGGILWIRRPDSSSGQIAIEPWSWKGEQMYLKGHHVPHVRKCVGMRGRVAKKMGVEEAALII